MQIKPSDYDSLRSWLIYMVPKVFSSELINPETDPVAVLDQMALKSPAKARNGLGIMIGDIIEFTSGWSAGEVTACDHDLSSIGLPTLSEVKARFSRIVQRAVRRGRIDNVEEFYALRNAVESEGSNSADLWSLPDAYERNLS